LEHDPPPALVIKRKCAADACSAAATITVRAKDCPIRLPVKAASATPSAAAIIAAQRCRPSVRVEPNLTEYAAPHITMASNNRPAKAPRIRINGNAGAHNAASRQ
jgi:hypothetical protein